MTKVGPRKAHVLILHLQVASGKKFSVNKTNKAFKVRKPSKRQHTPVGSTNVEDT